MKISQYTSLSSPQGGDELVIVDVNDTTMAPSGTTKKITLTALLGFFSGSVASVFGRTGAVVATTGDYTAAQVGALPAADDLSAIAAANPTAANWSNNSHKITSLANGSAAQDAAAFGQIPAALPPNGSASGDLSGSYPSPTVAKVNGGAVPASKTIVGTNSSGQIVDATSAALSNNTSGNAATATNLAGGATFPDYVAPAAVTLADAATVPVDASLGNFLQLLTTSGVGASRTIGAPSHAVNGEALVIAIQQAASGGPYTVTWTSGAGGYSFGTDGPPTLSTAASAVDEIGFRYHGGIGKWLCQGWKLGFS